METTHTATENNHSKATPRVHLTTDEPSQKEDTNPLTSTISQVTLSMNRQFNVLRRRWKRLDPDAQKMIITAGTFGLAIGAILASLRNRRNPTFYEKMMPSSTRRNLSRYSDIASNSYKASLPLAQRYMDRAQKVKPKANKFSHDLVEMIVGAVGTLAIGQITKRLKKRLP